MPPLCPLGATPTKRSVSRQSVSRARQRQAFARAATGHVDRVSARHFTQAKTDPKALTLLAGFFRKEPPRLSWLFGDRTSNARTVDQLPLAASEGPRPYLPVEPRKTAA